jgi:hypothetical protein
MKVSKVFSTEDLTQYLAWCDEDVVSFWMKCADYLLNKYDAKEFLIKHKKLKDGAEEEFLVAINARMVDTSRVPKSIQKKPIVEAAGIGMGLLTTLWLRPPKKFSVTMEGEGYDFRYLPEDSQEEELIEVTGTEKPGEGEKRLRAKIIKFEKKYPNSLGYVSVSCFYDKLLIHWGHKN